VRRRDAVKHLHAGLQFPELPDAGWRFHYQECVM
jgi:hypothetical protein